MDFDDEKSSYDVIDNATMSDDEIVASYGPPRSLFPPNYEGIHIDGKFFGSPENLMRPLSCSASYD